MIVDAHLDLSYNATIGRDVIQHAIHQKADEQGTPSVGLPDLRAGGVDLVCGTVFCMPRIPEVPTGYQTPEQAHAAAIQQLDWYHQQHSAGQLRLIRHASDLPDPHSDTPSPRNPKPRPAVILLMEGADPIRTLADVPEFFARGIRIVGLAWRRTRYAGGTGAPGPLTPEGIDLVHSLDAHRIIHDISHLAEESFWQLLELATGPVMASHSNCRGIVPTDRQLSDAMIRAIVARGGIIGINLFDKFLLPPDEYGKRPATLADVVRHIRHVCDLAADTLHVGMGSDMDGGFGVEHLPAEIRTAADLPKLIDALLAARFSHDETSSILSANWLAFFQRSLPH